MNVKDGAPVVHVKLGESPLTNFILMFSGQMHVLDDICVEMSRVVSEIESKELELEVMCADLYRKTEQPPRCPSPHCTCRTSVLLTKHFMELFKDMREHKSRFRALKERANSYIDGLKEREEAPDQPLDLTTKKNDF